VLARDENRMKRMVTKNSFSSYANSFHCNQEDIDKAIAIVNVLPVEKNSNEDLTAKGMFLSAKGFRERELWRTVVSLCIRARS
jgi:hypothetical protein